MKAIEFQTKIENGIIKMPFQYSDYANSYVRVIVLTPESEAKTGKKALLNAFFKLQEKDIFKRITNPVKWQKQLRNEWE